MSKPQSSDPRTEPLAGRTVLVTGGAHRVGGAVSRHLAQLGARIVVAYHSSAEAAEALVARLPAGGRAVQADLASPQGAGELLAVCAGTGDLPDAVVHSAASFLHRKALDTTAEEWDRVFALNTRAFFLLARDFARRHGVGADGRRGRRDGSGGGEAGGGGAAAKGDLSLIAIADAGALELWIDYAVHCVSKAALLPLVQVLAKSLGPAVRVNAVLPGPVLPEESTSPDQLAAMAQRTLVQRLGEPDDVARAVAYLLTARFCTGTLLEVTGGSHLWRGQLGRGG